MLPPLSEIPADVASVSDYQALARERVDAGVWAYLEGGAADERSARANLESFHRCRIVPRHLRDLRGAHTGLELFGCRYAHPVFVAPTAYHRLFHPEAERASLLGAAALQACYTLSTLATTSLEEIAERENAGLWFQLYIQPDRDFTLELVRRAERAGYQALVLTVDAPLGGLRNREQRAGFRMPPRIQAVNLAGMKRQEPVTQILGGPLVEQSPTWEDVAWLAESTRLPVLAKGILHADDARRALDEGAAGVVVSNHGGRILDGAPAPFEVLPEIAGAVAGRGPVLMDGGIRRGADVFKALCSGADAVMVGRPVLHGLAAAGAIGVAHVLRLLRTELEMTMALAGCADLGSASEEFLRAGS